MSKNTLVVACLLLLGAGCGSSTANGSDPGTGTGTLLVTAEVEVDNRVDNAVDGNGFDTRFEVRVRRGGQDVADAQVVVRSSSGTRTLMLEGDRYKGGHVGYDRSYTVEVTAGADNIRGAVIAGPSLHRFEAPLPGATVPAGQDVTVRWTRDGMADSATLETKKFKIESIQDTGSYVVPGTNFPGKPGDTEPDKVTLWRTTRVGLGGGLAGSAITATVRNRIESILVGPSS